MLTAALAICIAVNAIIVLFKTNPHIKKRKELEKQQEMENLAPQDPRLSLLPPRHGPDGKGRYTPTPTRDEFLLNDESGHALRQLSPAPQHNRSVSDSTLRESLVGSAAPMPYNTTSDHAITTSHGGFDEYREPPYHQPPPRGH